MLSVVGWSVSYSLLPVVVQCSGWRRWKNRCLINYALLIIFNPQAALRFQKILYVASVCLCQCDPPVLKRVPIQTAGGAKESNGNGKNWNWAEEEPDDVPHEYISVVQSGRAAGEVSGRYRIVANNRNMKVVGVLVIWYARRSLECLEGATELLLDGSTSPIIKHCVSNNLSSSAMVLLFCVFALRSSFT